MRRLAVAAASTLALVIAAAIAPPGGVAQQVIDPGQARPPLLAPALLSLALEAQARVVGPRRLDDPGPGCFREGPSRPCVQVCTQFVRASPCDRFPSASDGCLRLIGPPQRGRCLDAPPMARPTRLPWAR